MALAPLPPSSSSRLPSSQSSARSGWEEVRSLFRSAESLHRVDQYRREYAGKREEVRQQLSAAIATQVEDTRQGVQLLRGAALAIAGIRSDFLSIDASCREVKALISDTAVIARVNAVRKNVEATVRLLDSFRSLPEQCDALIDDLLEHDRHVKRAYLGLRKLFLLRETAFDPTVAAGFSADFTRELRATFQHLTDAADELELRVWENVTDCQYLAKDDPTVIIRTLEVIEMEDRAKRKLFASQAQPASAQAQAQAPAQAQAQPQASMKERCLLTLEKSIADSFAELHKDEQQASRDKKEKDKQKAKQRQAQQADDGDERKLKQAAERDDDDDDDDGEEQREDDSASSSSSSSAVPVSGSDAVSDYVCSVLDEMQVLLEQLDETTAVLGPCFPPSYGIIPFFEQRYRHWIKVTLSFHTQDVSRLSKKALLRCVSWMTQYMDRMRRLRMLTQGDADEWQQLQQDMILSFCSATEQTITALVDNILRAEEAAEAELNESGHYHTTGPADLFYTINQQMDIVLTAYSLRSHALGQVCLMLADVFTYYQNAQLRFLGEVELTDDGALLFGQSGIRKEDSYFAAVINNCELCRDNMDELKDKCLDRIRQEGSSLPSVLQGGASGLGLSSVSSPGSAPSFSLERLSRDIEDAFDDCSEGFISVASEAVDILVLQVMTTLQEPISALFTPRWLQEPDATADLTLTLQDFFDDYSKWISREAYFARLLRLSLHSLCLEYARRLVEARPQLSAAFFERLKADQVRLDAFFMRYSQLLTDDLITSELSVLQLIQETLQADLDSLPLHFDKMLQASWGQSAVLETLLSLRPDCGRAQRKALAEQFLHHCQQRAAATASVPAAAASASRSSVSSSFVGPNSGFFALFQSRGKPASKVKPSAKRNSRGGGGGGDARAGKDKERSRERGGAAAAGRRNDNEAISLEDFLK